MEVPDLLHGMDWEYKANDDATLIQHQYITRIKKSNMNTESMSD